MITMMDELLALLLRFLGRSTLAWACADFWIPGDSVLCEESTLAWL